MATIRLLFIILACSVLWGQDYQESMQVKLVEMEVKTQDVNGNFITDLAPQDFQVKESGKVQKIEHLEEIDLHTPTHATRKSRVMLFLDLKNTSQPIMNRVFPQIREYVQTRYTGKCELGLALYGNGIMEFTGFTSDQKRIFDAIDRAEKFFKTNKLRSYGKPGSPGPSSETTNQLHQGELDNQLYRGFISNHYRFELDVLGQFIRYLGAWSGKKSLILVSENWRTPSQQGLETEVDREDVISLRDIQTVCLRQNVAINTISLARSVDHFGDPTNVSLSGRLKGRSGFFSDHAATMAASTSGFFYKINYRKVAHTLDKAIQRAGRYYLLRYYSNSDANRFRNVKVNLKGAGRMAFNPDGYYPVNNHVSAASSAAAMTPETPSVHHLQLDTDWLHWGWYGWKKRRASYAVSLRIWDAEGGLLTEQVFTGELHKRKGKDGWPEKSISKKLRLNAPVQGAVSLETRIMDLTTGKVVVLNQKMKTEL